MSVIVIGAGAAGMMAALTLAKEGVSVQIIERNSRPGIKLNLTGKGRCNLTNDSDVQALIKNVPGNGCFLHSAFSEFSSYDAMAFFEELGVPLKTERGRRVFPQSDRAKDITEAFERALRQAKVPVICDRAMHIITENGAVSGVQGQKGRYDCRSVIVATGGLSYPKTGSDGDGYKMASELGHTVAKTRPSLVPLVAEGTLPKRLEGLSLKNVAITLSRNGKPLYNDFGEMIFTANGLSGPVILSASAHVARDGLFPCEVSIDLKPALDPATLDGRLIRDFSENLNRDFSNALGGLLPSKLIPVIVELSDIPPDKKVNVITKAERQCLCALLKAFTFRITGAGSYNDAIITAGGISTKEIDPKNMASKLISGLFFAGEVMDVDAYTGGFNLQIAWSTGVKAARGCIERELI